MQIDDLVKKGLILVDLKASSKKRVLELSAKAIAERFPALTAAKLFEALTARERLGSTAMGKGLAIPHCRLPQPEEMTEDMVAAVVTLQQGVDYDAPDNQPVDLLFVMVVFGDANQQHLNTLAAAAELYGNEDFCSGLRKAATNDEILHLFESATKQQCA
jgi:PTS system nitrogen regulatory IIA component